MLTGVSSSKYTSIFFLSLKFGSHSKQRFPDFLAHIPASASQIFPEISAYPHTIFLHLSEVAVLAQSVEHWATGWTIGVLGFNSWQGLGIFLFTTACRVALGPTQPPIQWVPGALSLGVKWLGREADHSTPSSAEIKE
jgi:hypothetical protein